MKKNKSFLKFTQSLFYQLYNSTIFDGAATLSFYFMLAIFPGLMLGFSLLSWFSLNGIEAHVFEILSTQVPREIKDVLILALDDMNAHKANLGFVSLAIFVGFWTVSSGVAAALRQVQWVHHDYSTRNFIFTRFISIFLTLLFSLSVIASLSLLVLGDLVKKLLSYNEVVIDPSLYDFTTTLTVAWIYLLFLLGLYYFGSKLKLRALLPGAILSTLGFLALSRAFSFYITHFTNYSTIYGSIAAVIILMFWFYVLGFLIILGAEVNEAFKKA